MEELKKALRKAIEAEFFSVQDWEDWKDDAPAVLEIEFNGFSYSILYDKKTCKTVDVWRKVSDIWEILPPEYETFAAVEIKKLFILLVNERVAEMYETETESQQEIFMVDDMRDTYNNLNQQF